MTRPVSLSAGAVLWRPRLVPNGHFKSRAIPTRVLSCRAHALRGFTLVEILVALAVTLVLMLAAVTLFATLSRSINKNVRDAEGSERTRHVREVLQRDLASGTLQPTSAADGQYSTIDGQQARRGFFECGEFPQRDADNSGANSVLGDRDDYVAFTVRSDEWYPGIAGQMQVVIPGSGGSTGGGTTTGGATTGGTTTGTTTGGTTVGGATTGGGCGSFTQVIDNIDIAPNFTFTGAWTNFTTLGYPNSGSFWYAAAGTGSISATYTFSGLAAGNYKVYSTWVENANRGNNVPYVINGGGSPVNQAVNQRVAPTADITLLTRPFKLLTTIAVTGSTLTVTVNNNANGYAIADAVYIECVGGGTTTGASSGTTTGGTTVGGATTGVGTTGTTSGGTSTGGGTTATPTTQVTVPVECRSHEAEVIWFVHNGILYRRVLPILPGATLPDMPADQFYANYSISARQESANHWVPNTLRDLELRRNRHAHGSAAPYRFSKSELIGNLSGAAADQLGSMAVLDNVVSFDMKVWDPGAPIISVMSGGGSGTGSTTGSGSTTASGTTTGGTTVGGSTGGTTGGATTGGTTTGGTTTGTTTTGGTTTGGTTTGGSTTGGTTTGGTTTGGTTTGGATTGGGCGSFTQVIDNNDLPASAFVGTWTTFATLGYPNSGAFRYAAAGTGSITATYTFSALAPGNYKVYSTWVENANRGNNVPYILNGGGSPVSLAINQRVAPTASITLGSRPFQLLTTTAVTSSTLTVLITNNANGYAIADAVYIECAP